jgi:hypothetical protein
MNFGLDTGYDDSCFVQSRSACHLLHGGFLLGLLFDPEDEGDMFLLHVR